MKTYQRGNAVAGLLLVLVWLVGIVGWGFNIYKIICMDFAAGVTGMMVARIIGVFIAPLGAVLGFC